ncbi:hypothetical protein [Umezawaea sp. Da 62-37]|uniref:CIS tube protein n=1 Tax=Umezawaea sp. Da 62-37 TaxID=3075927 RepID=UPI0028F715A4|nr:hypothetical protein [Umezawaea sp. Da 62-37]WNV87979.1 hypothetical protein RM788_06735 [Umezawaea sp. Da 62-37]
MADDGKHSEGFEAFGEGAQAMLTSLDPVMPGIVVFDFNPKTIKMSRTVDFRSRGTSTTKGGKPAGATGSQFKKSDAGTITISDIYFTGMDTKPRCDTLLGWASPSGGGGQAMQVLGGAANVARRKGKLSGSGKRASASDRVKKLGVVSEDMSSRIPMLSFSWGPPMAAFLYTVMLQSVTVDYVRFTSLGIPVRAKVNLTLKEQPNFIDSFPTNPTSGGPAGRGGHMITAGESLQSVATERYGSPGAWRALADANGIDDPLRVRPGDVVYLPHDQEMRERRWR